MSTPDAVGLEDEAFEVAATAALRAAAGSDDPRLLRAVDAAVYAATAQAYRTAVALIEQYGRAALDELQRRAAAMEAGRSPDGSGGV